MFVEANDQSTGELTFIQNIDDSRTNRNVVGSFVMVKNIKKYGILMLSSYKDKHIGHSFGVL
jgi:hypothetical protein